MSKTYINIGGQVIEPPSNLPDRKFRDAWVLDGDGGVTLDQEKATEITLRLFEEAIEEHLETVAKSKDYKDSTRLATYATSKQYGTEATKYIDWRDAVWVYAYAEMDKVKSGEREEPTIEDFIKELPKIDW